MRRPDKRTFDVLRGYLDTVGQVVKNLEKLKHGMIRSWVEGGRGE